MQNKFCPLRSNETATVACNENCAWSIQDGTFNKCAVVMLAENVGDVQQTLIDTIPIDED